MKLLALSEAFPDPLPAAGLLLRLLCALVKAQILSQFVFDAA